MAISTSGSRQGEKPEEQQPAQTALTTKREKLRLYNRVYYHQHKAQKREHNQRYHQLHRQERNATRRTRYKKNPAPFLVATRQWVIKHRDRRRASQKAWYQKHRMRVRAKHREYYHHHREEAHLRDRQYYATHRAAVRMRQRRYYQRRKAEKLVAVGDEL
jgi:hypothetical protein